MNAIRKMIGRCMIIIPAIAWVFTLASCNHKELCYPEPGKGKLNIIFDWKNSPDANPSSMALYLFHTDGHDPIRFIFQNNYGGTVRVPDGEYNSICLNADLTDWAVISGRDGIEEYEVSTLDTKSLSASGFSTRSIPRAPASEDERIAETPGMLWGTRLDGVTTPRDEKDKTVIMYPDEKVCHYSVDVYDSGDVGRYPAKGIDATLSGMSEGYMIGSDSPHPTRVTHPFILSPDKKNNSLHAEFLSFGEPSSRPAHHLSIYMVRDDGKNWNCNIDVTEQVRNAPDPRHVHIIVRGLDLPEPAPGGTAFLVPDVEDWETENITLKM